MDDQTRHRIAAVSALVTTFVATVLVGAGAVGAGGSAPVDSAVRPLAVADVALARELRGLAPGVSTKAAVTATRDALRAGERALRLLDREGEGTAEAARTAVRRHQALLDAVGSTLANPSSPLRDRLPALGRETARAFEGLGLDGAGDAGQLPATELAAFSRRRAAR